VEVTRLGWNVDGWYSSRAAAEKMRAFYLEVCASEAHVVEHHDWHSFGVVYAAVEPFVAWHGRARGVGVVEQ